MEAPAGPPTDDDAAPTVKCFSCHKLIPRHQMPAHIQKHVDEFDSVGGRTPTADED